MFGRRGFLTGVGATMLHVALAEYAWPRSVSAQGSFGDNPFTLGVASGVRRLRAVDTTRSQAARRRRRHGAGSLGFRAVAHRDRRAHADDPEAENDYAGFIPENAADRPITAGRLDL